MKGGGKLTGFVLRWLVFISMVFLPLRAVQGHADEPLAPHDVWNVWNWEPALLLGMGLAGWAYLRGSSVVWARAGFGRGVSWRQAAAFIGGLLALFAALVSPLDAMAHALFSAHMIQHMVLIFIVAPLFVIGISPVTFLWAFPLSIRRRLGLWWHHRTGLQRAWQTLTYPVVVVVLNALAIWLWHIPSLYQAALESPFLHMLEHASFLGASLLFWWMLARGVKQNRANYGIGVLAVFVTAMHTGLLGALLTHSRAPWYPAYAESSVVFGLTPLEDQSLGGAIMWVPGGLVYLIAAMLLIAAWFKEMDGRSVPAVGKWSTPSVLEEKE